MRDSSNIEVFSKDCIVKYLEDKYFKIKVIDNRKDDPPDFWLNIGEDDIALEITQVNEDLINNRTTNVKSINSFIDQMDTKYKEKLINKQIRFEIIGPLEEYKKTKKRIEKVIKEIIKRKNIEFNTVKIIDEKIKYEVYKDEKNPGIGGVIRYKDNNNYPRNPRYIFVEDILLEILKAKSNKMRNIEKRKWLGIYNNENMVTDLSYSQAQINDDSVNYFEKILIIFSNGEVFEFK